MTKVSFPAVLLAVLLLAPPAAAATVAGDFNGDGRQDLAVGVPGDTVGGINGAGSVHVFYGTAAGPGTAGDEIWNQGSPGIVGTPTAQDRFGSAVAAGDLDGDGFADLAIGSPQDADQAGARKAATGSDRKRGSANPGATQVIYGGPDGLSALGDEFAPAGPQGTSERHGDALAVGNFDGDRFDDLAIGEPGASGNTGSVLVELGARDGLGAPVVISQASPGVEGAGAAGEQFASALAAGDLDDDGRDELAVGTPGEAVGGDLSAGAINVLYGSAGGITPRGDQLLNQDSSEVVDGTTFTLGVAEPQDGFGGAIAAGDVNGDGAGDLAVGAPGEDISDVDAAGSGNLLFGSPRGITLEGAQVFNQDALTPSGNPVETNESQDRFAAALAIGDLDGDGFGDVLAGVPGEEGTGLNTGGVSYLRGGATGLTVQGSAFLGSGALLAGVELSNVGSMGRALATGRLDRGRRFDVAVGAPASDGIDGTGAPVTDSGAVGVFFGQTGGVSETALDAFDRNSPGVAGGLSVFGGFGDALSAR